jgi:uncharacterized protein YndB with AHSA1/START domain
MSIGPHRDRSVCKDSLGGKAGCAETCLSGLEGGSGKPTSRETDKAPSFYPYKNNPTDAQSDREIVITRVFDAPRELMWKAWTDPEHVKRWWGPKGFTSPVCKNDLRVGGVYLYCMRSSEGQDFWSTGVYRALIPPEQIVATDSFADERGNRVPASHYGMGEDWPAELLVTVTFEAVEGRTKLTLRHSGIPAGQMSDLTEAGWKESFNKLATTLSDIC